ncbi:MAG: response regulator [Hydrogenophaga sp.]|uniref:response regulator n=1 Tax=Hydrogenophaga sp. TaxID=1904254 RepID=UPI00272406D2|nr:response regulator [Hydrogenophaga sp.]MDO9504374.1 response regulator [Hydrogenophaga sp.]MDP2986519.1 response regulator [Hydrogenophaga sp.]MDP3206095.1 response regulator [Hydrogenophaga sp.]MDP3628692.1 response regulator [Hydrogenophaga sp.]
MTPAKILYVDDEAMALKYFERLVSPLAPVLTAGSVEEGRAVLLAHGADVAVLVCDQRMPGERGNELLRHAREYYPGIVRMLTTAYSELGDAIEAINTGEIYRYINKPWELESLRADLKNALELAALRSERDGLMRDKLLAQQSRLLANRLSALLMVGSAVHVGAHDQALHRFAEAARAVGGAEPQVDWHRWDHADLLQAEALRGASIAAQLREAVQALGPRVDPAAALQALARSVGGEVSGDGVLVADAAVFTALLVSPAGQAPTAAQCAWLAWLLWQDGQARVTPAQGGWLVRPAAPEALRIDWLADAMERLGKDPA